MGHQLLDYIRSLNRLRSELVKAHEDHQVEVEHLIKERDEVNCSFKDRSIKVEVLQEKLRKDKETSAELRTALDLEEEWWRKANAETVGLKEQILKQI